MLRRQRPQQLDCPPPAKMSADKAGDMDDDVDYDFVYRPLSNLPTPPMSNRDSESVIHSPAASTRLDHEGKPLDPELRGPAIHLINLIPTSASLATASVSRVQTMLADAGLPIETVALAVCILDSLGVRFARSWRLSCPLTPATDAMPDSWPSSSSSAEGDASLANRSKRHTLPPNMLLSAQDQLLQQQLHIDSVGPEVIILAALVIAAKFTDDEQERPSRYYCTHWGRDLWSPAQLNATERCIFESLRWRILPLCEEECLAQAMDDMRLAGRAAGGATGPSASAVPSMSTAMFTPPANEDDTVFSPTHCRSRTDLTGQTSGLGLGISFGDSSAVPTPRPAEHMTAYFS